MPVKIFDANNDCMQEDLVDRLMAEDFATVNVPNDDISNEDLMAVPTVNVPNDVSGDISNDNMQLSGWCLVLVVRASSRRV